MKYRGKHLYFIECASYPKRGPILNVGRFYSWNCAEAYLLKHLGEAYKTDREQYTIMCENGCPF